MIKALLLIFSPVATWDRLVQARRGVISIWLLHVMPLLVLAAAVEGYGLVRWGKWQSSIAQVRHYTKNEVIVFEAGQILLSLVVVFLTAYLLKSLGETFHGRHTFKQAFTAVGYGLGPLFLLRLANALPFIPSWLCWVVGVLMAISALYHGVPKALDPDPPQAFGLFVMTAILVFFISGLICFITTGFLQGWFTKLDGWVSSLAGSLPF